MSEQEPPIQFSDEPVASHASAAKCPVCSSGFESTASARMCSKCRAPHHFDCWKYNGQCGVFGCQPRRRENAPGGPTHTGPVSVPQAALNLVVQVVVTGVRVVVCLFAVLFGLLMLIEILFPRRHGRERANTRACYANQKTVVGAIEMYNLDKNTKVSRLDAAVFHDLKSGGYLQSIPDDPGQGQGSAGHYKLTTDSANGIDCTVHGSIQGPREREPVRRPQHPPP